MRPYWQTLWKGGKERRTDLQFCLCHNFIKTHSSLEHPSYSQIYSFTPGLHFYQHSGLTSNVCFLESPSQTIQSTMTVSKMCVLSQDAIKQPINLFSHRSGGWKSEIRMSTWSGSGEGCLPFFQMIASPLSPHVVETETDRQRKQAEVAGLVWSHRASSEMAFEQEK